VTKQAAVAVESPPDAKEEARQKSSKAKPKKQPPYAVVLLNDDDHTFQFVVETLAKVFGYPIEKCVILTEQVHLQGRGIVWSGTLELAELKRDQIRSAGPDFYARKKVGYPLGAIVEPLPG
jgi:ATP-dependent Clp protease adaptor protein ClpS